MFSKAADGFFSLLDAEPYFNDVTYAKLEIKPQTISETHKGTAGQDMCHWSPASYVLFINYVISILYFI